MWNKRKWYSLLLVGFVLILATSVMACAPPTETVTSTVTTTATTTTRGSVLEYDGSWLPRTAKGEPSEGELLGFQITAKVQNLGDAGNITVFASINVFSLAGATEEGLAKWTEEKTTKHIEVYLRQGEEKQLNFQFHVEPYTGVQSTVWCVP